jgi:xanthine dehydrogenase YagR molybdenum-binding subunit
VTSQYENFHRQETGWSGLLYTCANAKHTHKLARLDLATSCDMRGPSATTAVYALESAMDELAVALRIDPLDLRLRCHSDREQHSDRPYSSKNLRDCYRQGASPRLGRAQSRAAFDARRPEVGWGMAVAFGKRCGCRLPSVSC